MKTIDNISKLRELPNVGKAIEADLILIGIEHPRQLIDKDPLKMYEDLCRIKGEKIDPCIIDVFISVSEFIKHGEIKPWWRYTEKRKKLMDRSNKK